MSANALAWRAAIRLANGRGEPGDEAAVLAACPCVFCCDRAYLEEREG